MINQSCRQSARLRPQRSSGKGGGGTRRGRRDHNEIKRRGRTEVDERVVSVRPRVDHFGRGLQVVADRCNSSATNRVVERWGWWWRTARASHHRLSIPLPSRALSFSRCSVFLASSLSLLPCPPSFPPSYTISPPDFHPPTASSNDIPCTHRLNVSLPLSHSVPPLSFVIHPRSLRVHPHHPVRRPSPGPFQPSLILAMVYYARTNRVAHVGPPRESVQPSPCARHPPDGESLWRLHLALLSGYLAGSVLAWRPFSAYR